MKAIVYRWKDNAYKEVAEISDDLLVRGDAHYTSIINDWIEQQDNILAIKMFPKLAREFSNGYVEVQVVED